MARVRGSLLAHRAVAVVFVTVDLVAASLAQSSDRGVPQENPPTQSPSSSSSLPSTPQAQSSQRKSDSQEKQSARILGVIPNYRAVSVMKSYRHSHSKVSSSSLLRIALTTRLCWWPGSQQESARRKIKLP